MALSNLFNLFQKEEPFQFNNAQPGFQSITPNQSIMPNQSIPGVNRPSGRVAGTQQYGSPIGPNQFDIFSGRTGNTSQAQGQAVVRSGPSRTLSNPADEARKAYQSARDNQTKNLTKSSGVALKTAKTGFANSYDNVYQNLDSQLDQIGGFEDSARGDIEAGTASAKQAAESGKLRQLEALGAGEERVKSSTKKNLRGMAEEQMNALRSAGDYLGVKGAGDSSAAALIGAQFGKVGLRKRSEALEQQQEQIMQIDLQRSNVESIASEEMQKLETNKMMQLNQIARDYQAKRQQLQDAKAGASFQEQQQLTELEMQAAEQLRTNLGNIENEVIQYKQNVMTWHEQRLAEAEDYKARIEQAGNYTGQIDPYVAAGNYYTKLVKGGTPEADARRLAQQKYKNNIQYGYGGDTLLDGNSVNVSQDLPYLQIQGQGQQGQQQLDLSQIGLGNPEDTLQF